MKKIDLQKTLAFLFIFLAVEIWSYLAFSISFVAGPIFIFIAAIFFALSLYRLQLALFIIFAELIVGSMGHLFFLNLGDFRLSIRTVFWLILILVFLFNFIRQIIKSGKDSVYLKNLRNFTAWPYFFALAFFVLIGLIAPVLKGLPISSIFSDFNAWLFFLLIFPLAAVFDWQNENFRRNLKITLLASIVWLFFKTMFFLAIFAHELSLAPNTYNWLRKTLVGEMTATLSGWPRIFLQSHIFAGVAYFLFFWLNNFLKNSVKFWRSFFKADNIWYFLGSGAVFSLVIISFSRSFWIAFALTLFLSLILVWRLYGFKIFWRSSLYSFLSLIMGFVFILLVVTFPYFNFSSSDLNDFNESFSNRVNFGSGEAALVSRWSLLPVLWGEIKNAPLFGQGFGATATYISSDPRVLERNPNGEYTTSAFEWGYLDIWLKIGFFGLASYLFLIFILLKKSLKQNKSLFYGLAAVLIFLAITHAFTPYLNHPLGIGVLLLSSCFICKNNI